MTENPEKGRELNPREIAEIILPFLRMVDSNPSCLINDNALIVYGDRASRRAVTEDSFAILRKIEKDGSFVNAKKEGSSIFTDLTSPVQGIEKVEIHISKEQA